MYLKSLELHGFKSFPNRTVLTFEHGATVIVGPNGSGKSNISDAMRWVLGEINSRNIRGAKMEDVIFGGTDARRPMGFAEVSVTFDNTDKSHRIDSPYDEITVTRRYYRSGDSEYLINRKPCRLKDITELFMNTGIGREGYSIIGQGRIAEILSKKSEDRRNIFEEAAGISKFRYQKQSSERKLEATQDNLLRAKDILTELEGRVGPLEKDAEKAKKYLEYYERKKRADVSLWLYDTQKLRVDLERAEEAFSLSQTELSVLEEALTTLKNQSDRLYEQSNKNKLLSEQLLLKINQSTERLHSLENALTASVSDAEHCKELIEQCRRRITEIDTDTDTRADEIAAFDVRIAELKEKVEELDCHRLELLSARQSAEKEILALEGELEVSLEKLNRVEQHLMDLRIRKDVLKSTKTTDTQREEGILAEIASYEEKGKKLAEDVARCKKSTESFQKQIDAADAVIEENTRLKEELQTRRTETEEVMNTQKVEYSGLKERVEVLRRMEEHFEGYGESVRFVMREYEAGRIGGTIYGPVSKLITMESNVVTAIETALGANLQNIVVQNEATAKAAIGALKTAKAGRATFYPLDSIVYGGETEEIRRCARMAGYVGRADKLISYQNSFKNVMEWLLGRTVIFDTLDHASVAARETGYKVRLVTLDGQVINAGGSYTGGSVKRDSGILSRASEIDRLDKKAEELKASVAAAQKELGEFERQMAAHEEKIQDAAQRKELLYTMSRAQFAALDSANAKLDANNDLLARLNTDREELLSQGSKSEEELASLEKELAKEDAAFNAIRAERETADIRRHGLIDKRDELRDETATLEVSLAEARKDVENVIQLQENCRTQASGLKTDRENQELRIREYEMRLSAMQNSQEENRGECEVIRGELSTLNAERDQAEALNQEVNAQIQEVIRKERDKNEQMNVCLSMHNKNESKLNRLKEEQDRLSGSLWNEYEISYEQAKALDYPPVTAENRSEVVAEQTSNKMRIRALGAVNVGAIEEYASVKERYDKMNLQVTDLSNSCDNLQKIVSQIEDEMRQCFLETFTQINKNFGEVFSELFGGGTGELSLTDPSDVLSCGIEIKAAPPGKIIKSLSLLSGGEQAFVAIALFFAILRVNPTPFCILDEIEAALDEVNVFRFGEYIKKFCDDTQFVLITHRRGTMEVAERLYGITMPEKGVSRAIALDVNEIESKKKELLPDEVF